MSCATETLCISCSMSERVSWLDGWRGIACWLMVIYHLLFDIYMFGWMSWDTLMSWPLVLLEKYIAYSFILCAGVSATVSRNNLRHGLIVAGAGVLVVAASFMVDSPIRFGVLQFLSAAMIVYHFLGKWAQRVPEKIAPILWLALFVLTHIWTDAARVDAKWLFWLGFRYEGFVSYDYFPLLPYLFLFFLGSWAGQMIKNHREKLPFLEKQAPKWLTWPGSRTLWIYLIHQPVLYGACYLASRLL